MSLEETAQKAFDKAVEVRDKAQEIMRLAELVATKPTVAGKQLQYSQEDRQWVIQEYGIKKGEIKNLVDELP